jgi:hypothetical protein
MFDEIRNRISAADGRKHSAGMQALSFLFCLDSVAGKVARALPLKHRGRAVTRTTTNKAAADRRTRTMRAACSHERACHSLASARHPQMRGPPKRRTTTGWLDPLLLFPTAGTPPAERSGQNLSGPKRAARIIIVARLNCRCCAIATRLRNRDSSAGLLVGAGYSYASVDGAGASGVRSG